MEKAVAFIANTIKFGGGERVQNMLIDEIRKRGYKVFVYTYNEAWEGLKDKYDKLRILKYIPVKGQKLKSVKELTYVLKEDKPVCLITFSLALAETAVWAARKTHVPFLTSERCDPWQLPEPATRWIHRVFRDITFRLASGIVFQTQNVQNFFSKSIRKHSKVIHNPVIDDNLPTQSTERIPKKEIVGVGRLSPEKNFKMLIEAFSKLKNADDYVLKIYGEGPLKEKLNRQIESLGLQDKAFLMGRVDRVIDYISNADIFVLTSHHEGMPNALIEGMAMGLACISTDFATGGAGELIESGKNGLLIPVNDTDALVKELQHLIDDSEFKEKLKKEAIKIRDTHSKDIIIPQWVDYIESLQKI